MVEQKFVIVGASLAGATAATTLRAEGFTGSLVVLGEEAQPPYERPPLSKGYLQGNDQRDDAFVHPLAWYAEHDIDLRTGATVTAIDRDGRVVELADGERVGYDALLLATGSRVRRLDVPGTDLTGVRYLRTMEDCEDLRGALESARRVAVVGAGWIGLEVAAAARGAGLPVTVLEYAELPLLRVLGREVAELFADLHREHDVDLRFGASVTELVGSDGAVNAVRLADGDDVPADLVVVGIGVSPVTDLAEAAGLAVENGVVVDEHLRTSDPAVYAAGDVASAVHPVLGKHIRVEHWENARRQGAVAAKSMLGRDAVDERPPYFFSDQYDLGMEYTGYVEPDGYDRVVFRGDKAGREFIAFWLSGRTVLAGMNVNVWDVAEDIEKLIGREVDPDQLADPAVALSDL